MKTQEILTELYSLFKNENHNGAFIQFPPRTRRIMELLRELNDTFDLPLVNLEEILMDFVCHAELSDVIINETLVILADAAAVCKTQSKLEEKNGDDGTRSEDRSHSHKIQCEEIDLEDGDDEILNRSLEKAMQKINELKKPEANEPVKNVINKPPVIANRECYEYVKNHIYVPLDEREFGDIETGFRLIWNHSEGQMLGDNDFKRSVDQYLTSIESPMDRGKMEKVVDLILEYQQEIGEWGNED